jgi:hypothetical protein
VNRPEWAASFAKATAARVAVASNPGIKGGITFPAEALRRRGDFFDRIYRIFRISDSFASAWKNYWF